MLIRLFLTLIILVAIMLGMIRRLLSMFTKAQYFVFGVLLGWSISQTIGIIQPW